MKLLYNIFTDMPYPLNIHTGLTYEESLPHLGLFQWHYHQLQHRHQNTTTGPTQYGKCYPPYSNFYQTGQSPVVPFNSRKLSVDMSSNVSRMRHPYGVSSFSNNSKDIIDEMQSRAKYNTGNLGLFDVIGQEIVTDLKKYVTLNRYIQKQKKIAM